MRAFVVCVAMVLTRSVFGAEHDADRARRQLKSDNYTVTWGTVPTYHPDAKLEIGDATALLTLRDTLGRDPKDRCVCHAINALTRLTKKDVLDKPVEEMDVEKTRRKILNLLRDGKRMGQCHMLRAGVTRRCRRHVRF